MIDNKESKELSSNAEYQLSSLKNPDPFGNLTRSVSTYQIGIHIVVDIKIS